MSGKTVEVKTLHNFSQVSIFGRNESRQEILYLLPQNLHLLESGVVHERASLADPS